ncbi:MAG: SCP2 sterol-binding domain-containing protein [Candidatus Hermodarchaeota archaeon]|jgi:putative sterol carrier protein|nr:SCP2 sterol-binding domain-containing protein [Candidatus Hermodarchaeota archaeon]
MSATMEQMFEHLIKQVNGNAEYREFVRNWVGAYHGKVLQLEMENGAFHIRLYRKGTMTLHKGKYPSPDVIYRSSVDTFMKLFTGQATFRELMKTWDLIIIGAGHESVPLGTLFMRVLQSS